MLDEKTLRGAKQDFLLIYDIKDFISLFLEYILFDNLIDISVFRC